MKKEEKRKGLKREGMKKELKKRRNEKVGHTNGSFPPLSPLSVFPEMAGKYEKEIRFGAKGGICHQHHHVLIYESRDSF